MIEEKLIFLNSQSPRSGHNFVAEVIRKIVDCETPIGDRSEIPFNPILRAYHKTLNTYFSSGGSKAFLDDLFINDIRGKLLKNNTNVLIKYTNYTGAKDAKQTFKDDIHILSIRDPKDCLLSLFKGMKYKKGYKSILKKMALPFGLYHYTFSKKYSDKILAEIPNMNDFFVIKYEDLVTKNEEALKQLINLFNSNISVEELKEKMDNVKVLNSSFYKEETNSKTMWEASEKSTKFNPVNRSKGFNFLQILGVKIGSKKLRKRMGYI
jgi:hypothetical protein